ncbi:calcium/sodium antiporter [Actinosynnema sp. NPDC023658]|uniref:calcium/sodium antiporter n=1 Tax=Actinosynnema sp. NPDC023658 TaxID=3155465 RepID=UPI0033C03188
MALVVGLAMLVAGAELVVRQGTALARRMGVSPLVVGLTVVSLGTSLPELAIGLNAAHQSNAGLAVGNIVGTNLVNVLLILGLAAVIRPVVFAPRTLRIDLPVMTGASVLLFVLARDGTLSTRDGLWLCGYGAAYLVFLVVHTRREPQDPPGLPSDTPAPTTPAPDPPAPTTPASDSRVGVRRRVVVEVVLLVVGLAVIVVGAEFLVDGAVQLARSWGASDSVVGLTVVAVGTSAPELVTTILSTVRGQDRSLALGNLLGSSVFNIALILGPTVLAAPGSVPVPDDVLALDLVLMVASALVCVPAFFTRRRLSRWEGGAFVTTYVLYMAWLLTTRL